MKLFDRLERNLFNTVGSVMGEQTPASWSSADGQVAFSGIVLFNNPTAKETLDQTEYVDADPYFEYLLPDFDGLKRRVDSGAMNEVVVISGVEYYVTHVNRISDGNNCKAYLKLVNDDYGPQNDD